jgi:hypothetical protein
VNWVDVPGKSFANQYVAFSKEGYQDARSVSVRFVNVESGEVLINSFCCQEKPEDNAIISEISKSIEDRLALQWGK